MDGWRKNVTRRENKVPERNDFIARGTLEWGVADHTLTSLSSYSHYEYIDECECDFTVTPLAQLNGDEDYRQWTQELRVTSPADKPIDYIAGVYGDRSDECFAASDSDPHARRFDHHLNQSERGNNGITAIHRAIT